MKARNLNQAYRLVWSEVHQAFIAVAEFSRSSGKRSGKAAVVLATASLVVAAGVADAAELPTGGQIVAGSGAISQSGSTLTVTQTSGKMAADWQSFSIGQGHTVNFIQPSASAVALNRVLGSNVSVIQGALNANGHVFLVNPNGVLFTPTAQVNVGGLVASTLNISADDFLAGNYRFSANSTAGVKNEGHITTTHGGTVALIAARIENTGSITAPQGKVLMGAGSTVRLDLGGPVKIEVQEGALNTLIAQGGAIRADGGLVYLTAKAAGDLASSVINHTGITEARTLSTGERGEILLMGDMAHGAVQVGGMLNASAPSGGAGGFIETSAAIVQIADGVKVSTAAAHGTTGNWLIDPTDFTIASGLGVQTGSGIGATTLQNALSTTDVTIATSAIDTGGELGDINVNSAVSWSTNKLTLSAHNNININALMDGGAAGKLSLRFGQATADGGSSTYNVNASVNLAAGPNFSTQLGSTGPLKNYTVITALGAQGSTSGTDLQGINGGLAANYVLGSNIDASATAGWDAGAGFVPMMVTTPDTSPDCVDHGMCHSLITPFSGIFDGLGHSIDSLTINRTTTDFVGLFGRTDTTAVIRNVGLVGGTVSGQSWVGALVGDDSGTISHSYATSTVTGTGDYTGGLVGAKHSSAISNSYSTGDVTGRNYVGGLLGFSDTSTISNSHATGNVSGDDFVGGMVGQNYTGSISNSFASGAVTGRSSVGGLVGFNGGYASSTISGSYATGSVSSDGGGFMGGGLGGLVGSNDATGTINKSYATGALAANFGDDLSAGGLVGDNSGAISNSYATGTMTMGDVFFAQIGGLVGRNHNTGTISNSYATGALVANFLRFPRAGGLVGDNSGAISNSYATGTMTMDFVRHAEIGGLVGSNHNTGTISNSYATGTLAANFGDDLNAGGLVGVNSGAISNSYATGVVSVGGGGGFDVNVGGLVGRNSGAISSSYWNTDANLQGIGDGDATGASALSAVDMKNASNLVGFDFETTPVWGFKDGINNGYPVLCALGACFTQVYISPLAGFSVYGSAPVISYSLVDASGALYSLTNATVSGTAIFGSAPTSTSNAGSYTFSYDSGLILGGTDASKYVLLAWTTPTTWKVNRADAVVTANSDSTKVYNGAPQSVTGFGVTGLVNGDTASVLTGVSAGATGTNAGSYTSTASGTAGNYNLSFVDGTLTIKQLPITVTADNQSKVYGNADPSLTYQVTTGSVVDGDSLGALTRTAGENVNSYTINASALANGNYLITAINGTLTIGQRPITVTADNQSKVYGNVDPSLTYQVTAGSVVGSDSLGTLTRAAGENVDSYTINASALANGNYLITANNGTLTISQRPITVTADNQSKVYGDADPSLTYQVTTGSVVGSDSLGALTRAAGENVDSYTIDASALSNGNYLITANDGTLTISQRPITVTADNQTKVYGNADPLLTYAVTSGSLVSGDNLSGVLTRAVGEAVGNYTINASALANGNYLITANNGTLTISLQLNSTPLTAAITSASQASTQAVSAGFVAGDTVFRPNGSSSPASVVLASGASSGGLAWVDVADAPSGQSAGVQNTNGFMPIFVVRGGINMGDNRDEQ